MDVPISSPHIQFHNFLFHKWASARNIAERWHTFTCLSLPHFKFWLCFSLKGNHWVNSWNQKSWTRLAYISRVDPGSGPRMVSHGRMMGPWGLVSTSAHAGSSMTAVHTSSSVRQLLDFPCLFQLTLLLMCFSDSMHTIKDSFIMMVGSSYFVNCTHSTCLIKCIFFYWSLLFKSKMKQICQKGCPHRSESRPWTFLNGTFR